MTALRLPATTHWLAAGMVAVGPLMAVVAAPVPPASARKTASFITGVDAEIGTPPLRPGHEARDLQTDRLPPLTSAIMEEYAATGAPKPSPLRDAVRQARMLLWAVSGSEPPAAIAESVAILGRRATMDLTPLFQGYRAPRNEPAFKNQVLNDEKNLARALGHVSEIHELLLSDAIVKERGKETRRWRANYDYMIARVEAQLAFLYAYQSALGELRKELPPRDPRSHGGWRLVAREKHSGDPVGRRLALGAQIRFDRLIKQYPGTPWEAFARRDRAIPLGLEWQPAP
jgi:hypothetical protein